MGWFSVGFGVDLLPVGCWFVVGCWWFVGGLSSCVLLVVRCCSGLLRFVGGPLWFVVVCNLFF